MPLPPGFKINGSAIHSSTGLIPPRVRKIIAFLTPLPADELMTTMDVTQTLGVADLRTNHPALRDYRETVDGKLFWGSRASIAQLRKQLAESEESHDES